MTSPEYFDQEAVIRAIRRVGALYDSGDGAFYSMFASGGVANWQRRGLLREFVSRPGVPRVFPLASAVHMVMTVRLHLQHGWQIGETAALVGKVIDRHWQTLEDEEKHAFAVLITLPDGETKWSVRGLTETRAGWAGDESEEVTEGLDSLPDELAKTPGSSARIVNVGEPWCQAIDLLTEEARRFAES